MIKEAAIQRKSDGKIWTGRRHSNVIHEIISEGETYLSNDFIQGFITSDNQFVDRFEAFKIAKKCGQIKKEPWANPTLMSEDLY